MEDQYKDSTFVKQGVLNTHEKATEAYRFKVEQKRWKILEYIRKNPYSSIHKIGKATETNYGQIYQIIREMLFVRLIVSKKAKNEQNGEIYDVYYIPPKKEEEGGQ